MPKNTGAKVLIVEELQNGVLSKKEIIERVKKKGKFKTQQNAPKTINNHLYALMNERIIDVMCYDLSVIDNKIGEMVRKGKINRNVDADGMVFALLKLNHLVVLNLIKKLETPGEDVENLKIVKSVFKSKIQNTEDIKESKWIKLEDSVRSIPLKLFLTALEEETTNNKINITVFDLEIGRFLKYKDLKKLSIKNENANIMFFEQSPIKSELKSSKKKSYKINEYAKIWSLNTKYVDTTGSWTAKKFLNYHKFNSPQKKKTLDEINSLFNEIIFYINSQNVDNKTKLQNKFAWGLSDETNADGIFDEFLNEFQQEKKLFELKKKNEILENLLNKSNIL